MSGERTEVLDITKEFRDVVRETEITEGIVVANTPHTSCGLFVNEFQAALIDDLKRLLNQLVADRVPYRHNSDCERGNAQSQLRAILLGRSVALGVSSGEPSLGRFQGLIFAELDGPRARTVDVVVFGR
jgi:secondary thiamine-phosphate synthase enzyme